MHGSSSILLYGRDLELLRIRAKVLEIGGNELYFTDSAKDAREILRTRDVDLLILCQTLEPKHCDEFVAEMRSHHPALKLLVLQGVGHGCTGSYGASSLGSWEGPVRLLEKVDHLLSPKIHGRSSAGQGTSGSV